MKWTSNSIDKLKDLCFQGVSNKEIAKQLGCRVNDVYAKRSALGITIDKCKEQASAQTMGLAAKVAEMQRLVQELNIAVSEIRNTEEVFDVYIEKINLNISINHIHMKTSEKLLNFAKENGVRITLENRGYSSHYPYQLAAVIDDVKYIYLLTGKEALAWMEEQNALIEKAGCDLNSQAS